MPNIFILQQTHIHRDYEIRNQKESSLTKSDLESLDANVKSQYVIAKYILEHNDCEVIQENCRSYKYGSRPNEEKLVKQLFPNGLPSSFKQLTFEQKKFLAHWGAGYFSVFSQAIPAMQSDQLRLVDTSTPITDKVSSAKVWQQREYLVLDNAQKIAKKTGKDVIIIYGKAHSFVDVAECFPELNVKLIDKTFFSSAANKKYWTDTIASIDAHRPMLNCDNLALLSGASSTPNNTNSNSTVNYAGCALMTSLIVFGIFKYASRVFSKPDTTPLATTNTSNKKKQ